MTSQVRETRDVKFAIQIIWSDSPQMGQIWNFLISFSVHFECLRTVSVHFNSPIWGQSDQLSARGNIPEIVTQRPSLSVEAFVTQVG